MVANKSTRRRATTPVMQGRYNYVDPYENINYGMEGSYFAPERGGVSGRGH